MKPHIPIWEVLGSVAFYYDSTYLINYLAIKSVNNNKMEHKTD